MNRRHFLRHASLLTTSLLLGAPSWAAEAAFPVVRTPEDKRQFKSRAVERTIETIQARIGNKELGWMFENCFPNTLDTTVDFEVVDGRPDTYVITGDIRRHVACATARPGLALPAADEERLRTCSS